MGTVQVTYAAAGNHLDLSEQEVQILHLVRLSGHVLQRLVYRIASHISACRNSKQARYCSAPYTSNAALGETHDVSEPYTSGDANDLWRLVLNEGVAEPYDDVTGSPCRRERRFFFHVLKRLFEIMGSTRVKTFEARRKTH